MIHNTMAPANIVADYGREFIICWVYNNDSYFLNILYVLQGHSKVTSIYCIYRGLFSATDLYFCRDSVCGIVAK